MSHVEVNELGKSVADLEAVLAEARKASGYNPITARARASFRAQAFAKAQKTLRQLRKAKQSIEVIEATRRIESLLWDMREGIQ